MTTKIIDGKDIYCQACGWVGKKYETQSMAGFEFCPACGHRHAVFMPEFHTDQLAQSPEHGLAGTSQEGKTATNVVQSASRALYLVSELLSGMTCSDFVIPDTLPNREFAAQYAMYDHSIVSNGIYIPHWLIVRIGSEILLKCATEHLEPSTEKCDCDPGAPHDCICKFCRARWLSSTTV